MSKKFLLFIASIGIALGAGWIANFLSGNTVAVYQSITLPAFAPPPIVFPIVWTTLYVLMGISAAIVYTSEAEPTLREQALSAYVIQLLVNIIWPVIFFRLRAFAAAFACIILLVFLIYSMIVKFKAVSQLAAYLQFPYLAWVIFASILNLAIVILN